MAARERDEDVDATDFDATDIDDADDDVVDDDVDESVRGMARGGVLFEVELAVEIEGD